MGIELVLATFKEESSEGEHRAILQRLAEILGLTFRNFGSMGGQVDLTDDALLVNLPGGTAEIHSNHASFPIQELDPLTVP